jgi:hypothetical protein
MDYVAQLISPGSPQPEPMYLFRDVLTEFFRQRLLLNRLVADRGIDGPKIKFMIIFPHKPGELSDQVIELEWEGDIVSLSKEGILPDKKIPRTDVLISMPGGTVGRHALYGVLENLMRNSVKYGSKNPSGGDGNRKLIVTIKLVDPGQGEDFRLLELSDNFSGFPMQKSGERIDPNYEDLCKKFEQALIDKGGNIQIGGRGLIEIKEAMRFLYPRQTAEEPSACRSCIRPPGKVRICGKDLDNVADENDGAGYGKLVYRLRLRRPCLLGIWDPATNKRDKRDLPSQGIVLRSTLDEKGHEGAPSLVEHTPHMLVVVDRDDGHEADYARQLAQQHWRLPFRLMIVTDSAAEKGGRIEAWENALRQYEDMVPTSPSVPKAEFLPANRVRVAGDSKLYAKLTVEPETGSPHALVNEVYDLWLRTYKPQPFRRGGVWHLVVCFDRGTEITTLWQAANDFSAKSTEISVYHSGSVLAAGKGLTAGSYPPENVVYFGNHGSVPDFLRDQKKGGQLAFSQDFGFTEAPRTFTHLYSPPAEKESFKFFVLGLIESALTEIAVFDERTLGVFFWDGKKQLSPERIRDARRSSLLPLIAIPSNASTGALARTDLQWPSCGKPKESTKDFLIFSSGVGESEAFVPLKNTPSDVLLLHEGLIEELLSHQAFKSGCELSYFSTFSRIVRMSGKGPEPRKLDSRIPFCDYSAVSMNLFPFEKDGARRVCVEKVHLARALLNCVGTLG